MYYIFAAVGGLVLGFLLCFLIMRGRNIGILYITKRPNDDLLEMFLDPKDSLDRIGRFRTGHVIIKPLFKHSNYARQ